MPLDLESVGGGALSGIAMSVMAVLGIKDRVVTLEKTTVKQETCKVCSASNDNRHKEVMDALKEIREAMRQ